MQHITQELKIGISQVPFVEYKSFRQDTVDSEQQGLDFETTQATGNSQLKHVKQKNQNCSQLHTEIPDIQIQPETSQLIEPQASQIKRKSHKKRKSSTTNAAAVLETVENPTKAATGEILKSINAEKKQSKWI